MSDLSKRALIAIILIVLAVLAVRKPEPTVTETHMRVSSPNMYSSEFTVDHVQRLIDSKHLETYPKGQYISLYKSSTISDEVFELLKKHNYALSLEYNYSVRTAADIKIEVAR